MQWLKERFLYLLASSASNGSQQQLSQDLLGYWAEKKNISGDICFIFNRFYRSYLNSESVNWCVALKLWYLLGVKNRLRTSPQIRILVLLRGSFQNFWQATPAPSPPSLILLIWVNKGIQIRRSLIFFSPNPWISQNFRLCPELYCLRNSCRVFSPQPYLRWLCLVSLLLGWVRYSFV